MSNTIEQRLHTGQEIEVYDCREQKWVRNTVKRLSSNKSCVILERPFADGGFGPDSRTLVLTRDKWRFKGADACQK